MPKIFLIKNRLHQQQLRLLEAQNAANSKSDLLGDSSQPLSLIVHKKDDRDNKKEPDDGNKPQSGPNVNKPTPEKRPHETVPPRRFISSILGGDVPYGHVLTRAERKEYPIPPPDKIVLPTSKKPPEDATPKPKSPLIAPIRQFSVIQRTPKTTSKRDEDKDARLPAALILQQEPEQDQPIDYHIPKRKGETEDENEERRARDQRRSQCGKIGKPISERGIVGKLPVTTSAAAGHGRGGASGGQNAPNQSGTNSQQSGGGGGGMSFSGGGASGGSSGGFLGGGGAGGGGMNPGRDGRQNYGPSSPPTGSLPPFYESLKGGTNGNSYNAGGNFNSNYLVNQNNNMECDTGQELANLSLNRGGGHFNANYLVNNQHNMQCDTGQELANLSLNGGHSPPKQYSTLQNASYGIVMKDETDLDLYETKIDAMNQLLPGGYSGYDDSMMVDMVTGAVVDPLQFTANLTFSSSAEHALLESLSDAADLSTFLDNENEEIISPESNNQQQQIWSGLDSPTTMSLPSPGTASCSLDASHNDGGSISPPANVSGRRRGSAEAPKVLQSRLGLPSEVQLEFVNGGHGIKNPLASQETVRQGPRTEDKTKVASITTEDGQTNFCCRICNKTFALQRLLNRHMKCHSDVKRYLCTFCGKGFNDTFDLKRHTRTHTGVRPYKCSLCEKSFTQRCSLESHCLKVHGVQHQYAYKERRTKVYVCEECGHTTSEPEVHYLHLKEKHPYSPALLKFYDKRHFKFTNSNFANMLLQDDGDEDDYNDVDEEGMMRRCRK